MHVQVQLISLLILGKLFFDLYLKSKVIELKKMLIKWIFLNSIAQIKYKLQSVCQIFQLIESAASNKNISGTHKIL